MIYRVVSLQHAHPLIWPFAWNEKINIYFIMLLTAINYNDVHVYCKTKVNDVDWKIELEI